MTDLTLTEAERETVEACAAAMDDFSGPFHAALTALRALKPGARLPGGLAVISAELYDELYPTLPPRRPLTPEEQARADQYRDEFIAGMNESLGLLAPPRPGNGG